MHLCIISVLRLFLSLSLSLRDTRTLRASAMQNKANQKPYQNKESLTNKAWGAPVKHFIKAKIHFVIHQK